jgi:hypothetical protein
MPDKGQVRGPPWRRAALLVTTPSAQLHGRRQMWGRETENAQARCSRHSGRPRCPLASTSRNASNSTAMSTSSSSSRHPHPRASPLEQPHRVGRVLMPAEHTTSNPGAPFEPIRQATHPVAIRTAADMCGEHQRVKSLPAMVLRARVGEFRASNQPVCPSAGCRLRPRRQLFGIRRRPVGRGPTRRRGFQGHPRPAAGSSRRIP